MSSVSASAHRSARWCQSRLLRASREASNANTAPAIPWHTEASRRPNPTLSWEPLPDRPRSNDDNHLRKPKVFGSLSQRILQFFPLQVIANLIRSRLTNVDIGSALQM